MRPFGLFGSGWFDFRNGKKQKIWGYKAYDIRYQSDHQWANRAPRGAWRSASVAHYQSTHARWMQGHLHERARGFCGALTTRRICDNVILIIEILVDLLTWYLLAL